MDESPHDGPESREHGPLKSFLGHLEDLRWVLVKILTAVSIAWMACFYLGPYILLFLQQPLKWSGIEDPSKFLRVFSPAEAFSIAFQLALYAGLIISAPLVIYFIASFVLPALTKREKHLVAPAFWLGSLFFLAGVFFCYFCVLSPALRISREFANWLHISVEFWTVESYISFVTKFMIGMGIAFELPLVILTLVRFGILDYAKLSKARSYVIVLNFILGAVLTTPEVFDAFKQSVQLIPEVLECHMVAGGFDYLVKARVKDMAAYREFLGKTLLQKGVRETHTYAVMEEVKNTTKLPIR